MAEKGLITGLGIAQVDYKVFDEFAMLPDRATDFHGSQGTRRNVYSCPGGITPNAIQTIALIAGSNCVRLSCSVGMDGPGVRFTRSLDSRLGKPQIESDLPTGAWVGIIDNGGSNVRYCSDHGAGRSVVIDKNSIDSSSELFVSDLSSCREMPSQAQVSVEQAKRHGGQFCLNLGGALSSKAKSPTAQEAMEWFRAEADLVFGNKAEILDLTGRQLPIDAIETGFPNAKLVVITDGANGTYLRYEGETLRIPAVNVEHMIDQTGAGDSFMGVLTGILCLEKQAQWSEDLVVKAARTASYAASLVIQGYNSRLSNTQIDWVLKYFKELRPIFDC